MNFNQDDSNINITLETTVVQDKDNLLNISDSNSNEFDTPRSSSNKYIRATTSKGKDFIIPTNTGIRFINPDYELTHNFYMFQLYGIYAFGFFFFKIVQSLIVRGPLRGLFVGFGFFCEGATGISGLYKENVSQLNQTMILNILNLVIFSLGLVTEALKEAFLDQKDVTVLQYYVLEFIILGMGRVYFLNDAIQIKKLISYKRAVGLEKRPIPV